MPRRTQSWDAQGKDTGRGQSFAENSSIYFQRPVTLAFPRVLELQEKQETIRWGNGVAVLTGAAGWQGEIRVEMNILEQGWYMTTALGYDNSYPTLHWMPCPRLKEGSCD